MCARGRLPVLPRPTSSNRIGQKQASQLRPLSSSLGFPFSFSLISLSISRMFSPGAAMEQPQHPTSLPSRFGSAPPRRRIRRPDCRALPPAPIHPPSKPLSISLPCCAGHRRRWCRKVFRPFRPALILRLDRWCPSFWFLPSSLVRWYPSWVSVSLCSRLVTPKMRLYPFTCRARVRGRSAF